MNRILLFLLVITANLAAQHTQQEYSLYYENDAYELTAKHLQIIDSIKSIVEKDSVDVHIKGFTNSIGETAYNLELSNKRAKEVQQLLREFTIISSTGYGELASEASKNRRVDILVHHIKFHIPEADELVIKPLQPIVNKPEVDLLYQPKKGDKLALEGIMFHTDRDVILDESREALEKLIAFLKKNPKVKFKLIGHICCGDPMNPGKDLKNVRTGRDNLSEARAQALHNYLVRQGINKRRIRYIGMAFRQPTGLGDQYDKRVEIEITSID